MAFFVIRWSFLVSLILLITTRLFTDAESSHFFVAPDFVNALEDENHVYFFFREAAVEHINCGKVSILLYNY